MAGPGGREVGRVSIRVLPDTSKFATSLEAYLERIERRLELEIPVSLDARTVAQTEAELELLTRDRNIDIELNTQALASGVSSVTRGFARWAPLIVGASFAIGALVGALPALVANVAAPVAAIALGFDGVKEAASGLTDEVDHLKQVLSDQFETQLVTGFERLADLFPTLEEGLGSVAEGVSRLFDSFSRAVTTEESMQRIEDIFTNIGTALEDFAALGGVDAFADSLLLLTDAGSEATKVLTPEFAAAFRQFNDELERMAENGDLQKAMEGIGHGFLIIAAAIEVFVLGGLELFAMLERLGETLYTFATETVPNAWDELVDFTSSAWKDWHDAINIEGERVVEYVDKLPGRIIKALDIDLSQLGEDAIQGFWDGLKTKFAELLDWLPGQTNEMLLTVGRLLEIDSPSKKFRELGQFAGEGMRLGFEDSMKDVQASAALMATGSLRAASAASLMPPASPFGAARRRMDFTITNWRDGTGHFAEIADAQLTSQAFETGLTA